jgi:hypothetical protein
MLDGSPRAFPASALLLVSLLLGCGGSTGAAESPSSGERESSKSGDDSESTSGGESESDATSDAPAVAEKPSCDDGTCTPCGDALCPSGWYCDESAPGGAACGWLPECASKASCSCVKRVFSECSCEDRAGSAHVRCG